MALIKCKECGNQISSKANTCPNCGIPINNNTNNGKKSSGCLKGCLMIFIIFFALSIISIIFSLRQDKSSQNNISDIKPKQNTSNFNSNKAEPVKVVQEDTNKQLEIPQNKQIPDKANKTEPKNEELLPVKIKEQEAESIKEIKVPRKEVIITEGKLPKQVKATTKIVFPIIINGEKKGTTAVKVGTLLNVISVKDDKIILSYNDATSETILSDTDYKERYDLIKSQEEKRINDLAEKEEQRLRDIGKKEKDQLEKEKTIKEKKETAAKIIRTKDEEARKNPGANLERFYRINAGMSYNQVARILGQDGEEISRVQIEGLPTTVMYTWISQKNRIANMNATFQDDKLVSKAQLGLE